MGVLRYVFLLTVAVLPLDATAQAGVSPPSSSPASPAPGTPVRFRVSANGRVDPEFTTGTWVERGDDFIVVQEDGATSTRRIPLRSLSQFEMLTGSGPRTGEGAIIGSAAGAVAGLLAGAIFCEGGGCLDIENATTGDAVQVFGAVGAVGGALVGALLGAFVVGGEWQPVSFDSARSEQIGAAGRMLSVTFRF